jgi:hypothetical protein
MCVVIINHNHNHTAIYISAAPAEGAGEADSLLAECRLHEPKGRIGITFNYEVPPRGRRVPRSRWRRSPPTMRPSRSPSAPAHNHKSS